MVCVLDIRRSDNKKPASPTAQVTASRVGTALRGRFEEHIWKDECVPGSSGYEDKMTSRAISAFVVSHLCGVDDKVAGDSVCDNSVDGGIDAIHVNHSEKTVVVVQAVFFKIVVAFFAIKLPSSAPG